MLTEHTIQHCRLQASALRAFQRKPGCCPRTSSRSSLKGRLCQTHLIRASTEQLSSPEGAPPDSEAEPVSVQSSRPSGLGDSAVDISQLLLAYQSNVGQKNEVSSSTAEASSQSPAADTWESRLGEVCAILTQGTIWTAQLVAGPGQALRRRRLHSSLAAAEADLESPEKFAELLRRLSLQQQHTQVVALFEARGHQVNDEAAAIYLRSLCALSRFPELRQEASVQHGRPLQKVLEELVHRLQAGNEGQPALQPGGSPNLPVHVSVQGVGLGEQSWQVRVTRLLYDSVLIMAVTLVLLKLAWQNSMPQMGNFGGPTTSTSQASPPPSSSAGMSGMNFNLKDYSKETVPERSKVTFNDVKGCDEAKAELQEVVAFLKDPARFSRLGAKLPKGVLLTGPPGTGKTLLARAVAGEAKVPFYYCNGSEFDELYVGVGARRIRHLFAAANKEAPAIIFVDEIDAVGGARGSKETAYTRQTLNQLLTELDGFKANSGTVVIGATNTPESLDKALVRPGRFDFHVAVSNPDVRGRQEIIAHHFRNVPTATDVDTMVLARGTVGWSGADLANMVNQAALHAARSELPAVTMHSVEYAKDRILMGPERKSMVLSQANRNNTAYHEGGHALVAHHTPGANPVHKATIMPRGHALGMVMQLPEADSSSITRKQLLAQLDVSLGGRVAEELIFGEEEVTTGPVSDIKQATNLATSMVTKYGMSQHLGLTAINYSDDGRSLSPDLRSAVEFEVRQLISESYGRVQQLLSSHKAELHLLARELLARETLTGAEITQLLASASGTAPAAGALVTPSGSQSL